MRVLQSLTFQEFVLLKYFISIRVLILSEDLREDLPEMQCCQHIDNDRILSAIWTDGKLIFFSHL